jgi:uncharacterized protein YaiI (UPF0178 family)
MKVWIDCDGCPRIVRDIVFAACQRLSVEVLVVANSYVQVPASPLIKAIKVSAGFDEADHYIAKQVNSGDLVITSDVPLASRIVEAGCIGVNAHGQVFDRSNIADILSTRNLMQELRGGGLVTGGPAAFGPAEKKKFADAFDRMLTKMSRK